MIITGSAVVAGEFGGVAATENVAVFVEPFGEAGGSLLEFGRDDTRWPAIRPSSSSRVSTTSRSIALITWAMPRDQCRDGMEDDPGAASGGLANLSA